MNKEEFLKYYYKLQIKLENEEFLIDKSGVKLVELIAPNFILNPSQLIVDIGTRKSPEKYIKLETEWYNSQELSISKVDHIKIWNDCADINKEINSNYGYLVFGRGNFNQYNHCLNTLIKHKESRQAIIIYNRPSIHYEATSFDCKDFICTMHQQFMIRNNQLITVTSMRSNDCIFGTFNDIPWFHFVINHMFNNLKMYYNDLELGEHIFIPNSWHCYEQHFDLLRRL